MKPNLRNNIDTSNFSQYPDSDTEVASIKPEKDPFINWKEWWDKY